MNPKEFYKTYLADDTLSELSKRLFVEIMSSCKPQHILEFGCGTGKNLAAFHSAGINTIGLDISYINVSTAKLKHNIPCVICADETYLRNFANVDVVFTMSVLDHIEHVDDIISEFKRIANELVFLAETNDIVSQFYYKHDYESMGFKKIPNFEYTGQDGAKYYIWYWDKRELPVFTIDTSDVKEPGEVTAIRLVSDSVNPDFEVKK